MKAVRSVAVAGALVAGVAIAPAPATAATPGASAARHRATRARPVLVGARRANSTGRTVVLHWSQPVRILHRRRVWLLGPQRHRRRGKPVGARLSPTQIVVVAGHGRPASRPPTAVRVGVGAAAGPGGQSVAATVTISPEGAAPVSAPPPPSIPRPLPGASTAPTTAPTGPMAPLSSSFIDSVGVQVHMSYLDTPYRDAAMVRDELINLGVHHVRDGACVSCPEQRQALMDLAGVGIKTDFGVAPPGGQESLANEVEMLNGPMNAAVDSIEGPNEYDTSSDPNWSTTLRTYQEQLYQLVRGSPYLGSVPVLGPSMAWAQDFAPVGDLSGSLDEGNIHAYPGGQVPDANLATHQQAEAAVGGTKPVVVTEAGYDNALGAPGGNRPVSEAAAAAYVPRLFLDFYRAGITRTYLYELVDEWPDPAHTNQEANFGLLRNDLSEKPAYHTLQALLSAVAPNQPGPFARSTIGYQVAHGPSDLRQLLLQTGPGTYALVLWRNASVWNIDTYQDIPVASEPVTLTFGSDLAAASSRQLDQLRIAALGAITHGQPITLSLGAMPVVLELRASS